MAGFSSMASLFDKYQLETDKQRRISQEWQDYAYRLALELDDKEHTSLYMRLCKNTPRALLEEVRSFVRDARAKNKARLFMWKLKQLKEERKLNQKTADNLI